MAEYKVLEMAVDYDLSDFSRFLWQQGISHRIVNDDQSQYLLVGNELHARQVALAFKSLQEGELRWFDLPAPAKKPPISVWQFVSRFPVTLISIVLSVMGYLIVQFDATLGFAGQLTFFQLHLEDQKIAFSLPRDQYWRLITPVFLHFSLMHIIFNMLWLWDLGKRIELFHGGWRLFGVMLVVALGSNVAQAVYEQAAIFGGMSGVIYGLLGYGWIWSLFVPEKSLQIPTPIVIFMLVWLVLCMMGFTQLLGLGNVANAAHLGGLLIGLLIGLGAIAIEKKTP